MKAGNFRDFLELLDLGISKEAMVGLRCFVCELEDILILL